MFLRMRGCHFQALNMPPVICWATGCADIWFIFSDLGVTSCRVLRLGVYWPGLRSAISDFNFVASCQGLMRIYGWAFTGRGYGQPFLTLILLLPAEVLGEFTAGRLLAGVKVSHFWLLFLVLLPAEVFWLSMVSVLIFVRPWVHMCGFFSCFVWLLAFRR